VTVEYKDTLLIIDCGTGLRVLGNALLKNRNGHPINAHILISHTHWDHIQGFPFFIPAFIPKNTLTIYGAEGVNRQIEDTLAGQMETPYFPVTLNEMAASLHFKHISSSQFTIDDFLITTCFLNHPGVTLGFRISCSDGDVVYFSDHEPYHRLLMTPSRFKLDVDQSVSQEEKAQFASKKDQEYIDFCRDADLLIEDSPYTPEEYASKAGWGHACIDDVVDMAVISGVKRLALFHHDPSHSDEQMDRIIAGCQSRLSPSERPFECFAAREGQRVTLPSPL
jgi:phosphoribosyl 1,2-cyclic phosphodiesterase